MSNAKRRDKANYYLDIAQTVSERGTCLRRKFGAIIVNDDEVTLKRFFYYPEENQIVLQPENPAYRPMVYMNEELSHIRVLGKAVAFMSSKI